MTPRTRLHLAGRPISSFLLFGWSGFGLAVVLVLALGAATGRSVPAQAVIAVAAVVVYYAVAAVTHRICGRAVLVYYHHVLVTLTCAAVLAVGLGEPMPAHLDLTACGLAAFTALARVGCLAAGCCHGRPTRRGITYGPGHVGGGLPAYLVQVPLAPVQAVEAAGAAALAVIGTTAVLSGAPAGTAFVVFVTGYSVVRFGAEWLRGDLGRRYWARLSEAQWTSLVLAVGVSAAAAGSVLPGGHAPIAAAAALLAGAALTVVGRAPWAGALLGPSHVREFDALLDRLPRSTPPQVRSVCTSLGLRVSTGEAGSTVHYTVSADRRPLSAAEAEQLARLLMWLRHPRSEALVVPGQSGAVHIVTPAPCRQ